MSTAVNVSLKNLPIEDYVVNMAPRHVAEARSLWARFQPRGTFDALVRYESAGGPGATTVDVEPTSVSLVADSHRLSLNRRGGALTLSSGRIAFKDLSLDISDEDRRPQGTITLAGSATTPPGSEGIQLRGQWQQGRFESPLIAEILKSSGQDQTIDSWRRAQTSGAFDAEFTVSAPPEGQPLSYDVGVRPRSIDFIWNNANIFASIERGQLEFKPGQVTVRDVRGQHAGGAFDVDGVVTTTGATEANLKIGYDGLVRSEQCNAFLPKIARQALDLLKFDDGNGTHGDLDLHLKRVETTEPEKPAWQTDVRGRLHTRGAAFEAGVRFGDVAGDFDLDVHYSPGGPPRFQMSVNAQHCVAVSQQLTNLEATVVLSDDGTSVEVPLLRANAAGGVVTAQASVGIGDKRQYQTAVDLVAVPLDGFFSTNGSASEAPSAEPGRDKPQPRGELYADITVSGLRDDAPSRRGRAVFRVLHGKMANIPLALQVVQLVQFTLPFSGSLDYADADAYIVGDRAYFERILLESTSGKNAMLQLFGEGDVDINTLELNVRFRSRSGVAIIRDVVGGVTDRLYGIEVTGPLSDPKARVVPLPKPEK